MKVGLGPNSFLKFQDLKNELRSRNKKKLDDINNKSQMNSDTSLKSIFAKDRNDAHNAKNQNTDNKKGGSKGKDTKK